MATHDQVLSAARALFSRNGYDATTIQDIASSASVSVGTVYHHFSDKRKILLTLVDAWGEHLLNERRTTLDYQAFFGDDVRTAIHSRLRTVYDRLCKEPSLYLVILSLVSRDEEVRERYAKVEEIVIERLRSLIEFGQAQGLARSDTDAAAAAFLIHHAIDMAVSQLLIRSFSGVEHDVVLDALGDMICRFILAEKNNE